MLSSPVGYSFTKKPNTSLKDNVISYVDELKYLRHIINNDITERQIRSLATWGNLIAHKFHFCSDDVKIALFKCFCFQLYGCSLWSWYKMTTLNRLRVTYNKVLRRLLCLHPWCSASTYVHGLWSSQFSGGSTISVIQFIYSYRY